MKYYTFLISFFLIVLCSSFTNVENSENIDNQNCPSIEYLHVAYDEVSGNLLVKWDTRFTDVSYSVSINGLTMITTEPYMAVPIQSQFSVDGLNLQVRASCDGFEAVRFKGSLHMDCDGGLGMELEQPNSLKPEDDGGCCIIATSGNINVHNPCLGGNENIIKD